MSVKIIPISPEYRENWEAVFGKVRGDSESVRPLKRDRMGSTPIPAAIYPWPVSETWAVNERGDDMVWRDGWLRDR